MKGSPIIATAITIVVLLGLYLGMRAVLLPESSKPADAHAGHNHGQKSNKTGGHDDSALETYFELFFSSTPSLLKVTQPSTGKVVLTVNEFSAAEWSGSGTMSLEGHSAELQVDVEWASPNDVNFAQILVSPASHASKEKTLRSDGNISDIVEFSW